MVAEGSLPGCLATARGQIRMTVCEISYFVMDRKLKGDLDHWIREDPQRAAPPSSFLPPPKVSRTFGDCTTNRTKLYT